jgi:hypothetical protein
MWRVAHSGKRLPNRLLLRRREAKSEIGLFVRQLANLCGIIAPITTIDILGDPDHDLRSTNAQKSSS